MVLIFYNFVVVPWVQHSLILIFLFRGLLRPLVEVFGLTDVYACLALFAVLPLPKLVLYELLKLDSLEITATRPLTLVASTLDSECIVLELGCNK
jgi:hypothetical protein